MNGSKSSPGGSAKSWFHYKSSQTWNGKGTWETKSPLIRIENAFVSLESDVLCEQEATSATTMATYKIPMHTSPKLHDLKAFSKLCQTCQIGLQNLFKLRMNEQLHCALLDQTYLKELRKRKLLLQITFNLFISTKSDSIALIIRIHF